MTHIPVDSVPASPLEPDAHGQAALLLAESILHMLVETSAISGVQAISAVRSACEVKLEVAELTGESLGRMQQSLALLTAIADTFEIDFRTPAGLG